MNLSYEIIDNSDEILDLLEAAAEEALERCGEQAESYAYDLCPKNSSYLANSISHTVRDDSAYVGTNVEYAPYVELGTGKFYGGGRQDPWVYRDDEGNFHTTSGQPAQPYLKPAVADHKGTYQNIIRSTMGNA